MFEAQNKSQPKLVYTYAGQNNPNRDHESRSSSAGSSIVAMTFKDKVKQLETAAHRSQQNETKIPNFHYQQPLVQQKEQQKDQQQTKQEIDKRELKPHQLIKQPSRGFDTKTEQQKEVDRSMKQSTEHQKQLEVDTKDQQQLRQEINRRELQQLDQQRQPKQIEIGYISTKKGPAVSVISTMKENNHISFKKQSDVGDNEHNKSPQIPTNLYNSGPIKRELTSTSHTDKVQKSEIRSNIEKVEPYLKPATAINPEHKTKMILSSSTSEHHVFSISSKANHDVIVNHEESSDKDTHASNQAHVPPLTNTQKHLRNQHEQQNVPKPQQQQNVPGNITKEVQDKTKHVTSIPVQSHPIERKQTWPVIHKPDNFEQLPKIPNTTTPVSHQINSLALSSSTKSSEETSKPEINQDSTYPTAFSPTTVAPTNIPPPKSILKNSTSFDQTDLSLNARSFTFSRPDSETIPHFDFRSLLTATKDTPSKSKGSTNIFKRQIQSPFMGKIVSPPPQRKGRKSSESSTSKDELHKEGLGPKKSVTFDSEVRLHLEDEISTVETLSVDA